MSPPFSKNGFLKQNLTISYLVICVCSRKKQQGKNERKKKKSKNRGRKSQRAHRNLKTIISNRMNNSSKWSRSLPSIMGVPEHWSSFPMFCCELPSQVLPASNNLIHPGAQFKNYFLCVLQCKKRLQGTHRVYYSSYNVSFKIHTLQKESEKQQM